MCESALSVLVRRREQLPEAVQVTLRAHAVGEPREHFRRERGGSDGGTLRGRQDWHVARGTSEARRQGVLAQLVREVEVAGRRAGGHHAGQCDAVTSAHAVDRFPQCRQQAEVPVAPGVAVW
jgi:hypothetical protein